MCVMDSNQLAAWYSLVHLLHAVPLARAAISWFRGRVVCALDYEAGDPGSIPGCGGTTDWLFSAWWQLIGVLLPAVSAYTEKSGNKLFHPYQVGTFVDYPR